MRFGLLGPLIVHADGRSLPISGAKSRALLAALLFQANRAVPLTGLQGAVWGDTPPATAAASLNNHAARLRRALGPEGSARLRSTPYGLLLHVEADELDTRQFGAALLAARSGRDQGDWETVLLGTTEALALWRGEPLSDLGTAHGLHAELEHLRQRHLQALEWHFEAALELGHQAAITPELTHRAAQHPLHEALHAQLITALYRNGRQAEALDAFERIRTALAEELGVDPGPGLQALHQQVLRSDPALLRSPNPAAATAAAVHPPDAPEAAAATADVPTVAPAPAPRLIPAQLPGDAPAFTGRTDELATLRRVLEQAADRTGPRVVSVSGMGGVGKSALAVHAAHQLRELFPDGQLYLDLNGFGALTPRSPDDLLAAVIADLHDGCSPAPHLPDSVDRRAALLRTLLADRKMLVVLDNARDSAQVLPLLPGSGGSAVIVTSRHLLADLPGPQIALNPMDVEEQRALLSALCGPERVQQDPDGELRLLAACAGLPLALRITGARLAARPSWTMSLLADQLTEARLSDWSAGHLGLRDTFASSYQALEPESRRAFRLLGLWAGHTLGVRAAAALLRRPLGETTDLLEGLVDASLLQSPTPLRYRFHDLLGEYADERADEEESCSERQAATLRLCQWYALALERVRTVTGSAAPPRLNEPAPSELPHFAGTSDALSWCREELANIREAVRRTKDSARPELSWRLAVNLFDYMQAHWWTDPWDEFLDRALRSATENGDQQGRAWLLRTLGANHGIARRDRKAFEALLGALPLFQDPESRIVILSNLSLACTNLGLTEEALFHARRAFDLQSSHGDPERAGLVLNCLADALRVTGHYEEAETRYRAALDHWRRRGNVTNIAITMSNVGDTLRGLDRRDESLAMLEGALRLSRQSGHPVLTADFLLVGARTHAQFGDLPAAKAQLREALELADEHRLAFIHEEARHILKTIEAAGCELR